MNNQTAVRAPERRVVMDIKNLTKKFPLEDGKYVTACDDINLRAYEGYTLRASA